MPKKGNIWVTQHTGGGWQTKKENNERASSVHNTQQEAINAAVTQAKKEHVEVIVQGKDGKIRSKDSYGNESDTKDTEH